MSWNYRIIKRDFAEESEFAIYEVYYNRKKIQYISTDPVFVCGYSLEDLKKAFSDYAKAFEKPILDYNEVLKEIKKTNKVK